VQQEPQQPELTQEVFDTWEPVAGALQRFDGLSDQDVLDSLWARLASGLVQAAAETAELDGRPNPRKLMRVPKIWWGQTMVLKNVHHGFWKHGHAPLSYIAHSTVSRTSSLKTAQLFNVRLEPNGFRKIAQPPAAPLTAKQPPPMSEARTDPEGEVPHAEIEAWFEALTPAQQLMSGKNLWVLSKPAFHPRKVLRKQFDWITERRAPGPRKPK
jgi:hypothetical protein